MCKHTLCRAAGGSHGVNLGRHFEAGRLGGTFKHTCPGSGNCCKHIRCVWAMRPVCGRECGDCVNMRVVRANGGQGDQNWQMS